MRVELWLDLLVFTFESEFLNVVCIYTLNHMLVAFETGL